MSLKRDFLLQNIHWSTILPFVFLILDFTFANVVKLHFSIFIIIAFCFRRSQMFHCIQNEFNDYCHSWPVSICICLSLERKEKHICLLSFLDSSAEWLGGVSVYGEFLSHWHTETIHTPRWKKRMSVCHSATTSPCLGFNEGNSSSVTPQWLKRQERTFHCLPGTHPALSLLSRFGRRPAVAPLMLITHPDKKDYEPAFLYIRDELHLTIYCINPLWFWDCNLAVVSSG